MVSKFSTLPLTQRFAVLVGLAAAVAGLAAVALWTQQPDMQALFTNLSADDASAIVDRLKTMKVPYELSSGGSTVLVPSGQIHDLRLQLAGQGLPHGGGLGFEIFDRTSLGVSDFVQKVNYRRALQGELARTIAQLPEVERARVHLSLPERRLFSSEQDRARASVVLALKAGQTLSKIQVQGIVRLVASSVEGLQAHDVTVVDGHGRLLSGGGAPDETARLSDSQLEYQRSLEKDIEGRIQTMLERIVGVDKAVVRVSSVLDFRQVETTEERYDPNGQVVRSEQRGQEKASGSNGVSGGVPGVASNVPPGKEAEPVQTSSNTSQNKNETVNYEISRTVSKIVEPIGTIKRLSAAVLVDGKYEGAVAGGAPAEGEAAKKYVPRTQEEIKQIEEIVKKAMGFSADRGDEVQVVNAQFGFGPEDDPAGTEAAAAPPSYAQYIRYGVGGILFLLILFFVIRPLIAVLTAPAEPGALPHPAPGGAVMGIGAQGQPAVAGGAGQVDIGGGTSSRSQILDMAKNNPESTAIVVKQWLNNQA
ncbi:flagellar M-ring protein [Nitrospira sp.]|nr:flagellar M-ring protein [Nitrospira sp.]